MNKVIFGLAVSVATVSSIWLVGCAAKPVAAAPEVALECAFPGTRTAAPLWVCDAPVPDYEVAAVGTYEKTAAGIQFQKDHAVAGARVALAQRMKTHVANMIKQYAETTGAGSTETVDKVNASVSKLITDQSLEGSALVRSISAPDGTMYVLVAMTPLQVQKVVENKLRTSMNNEQALWQKFQAGKAQDELAADIAKQRGEFKEQAGQ